MGLLRGEGALTLLWGEIRRVATQLKMGHLCSKGKTIAATIEPFGTGTYSFLYIVV